LFVDENKLSIQIEDGSRSLVAIGKGNVRLRQGERLTFQSKVESYCYGPFNQQESFEMQMSYLLLLETQKETL
jgi:hypothetical protein